MRRNNFGSKKGIRDLPSVTVPRAQLLVWSPSEPEPLDEPVA
jgi:hypothetical protein